MQVVHPGALYGAIRLQTTSGQTVRIIRRDLTAGATIVHLIQEARAAQHSPPSEVHYSSLLFQRLQCSADANASGASSCGLPWEA